MPWPKHLKLWTVNIVTFILFSLLAVTGLINWRVLPHGGGRREGILIEIRHLLMEVHTWLAMLFLLAVAIHLMLHWSYIKANLKKSGLLKQAKPDVTALSEDRHHPQ